MRQISWNACCALLIASGALLALMTMQPGADYFVDSGAIDALVRGDSDSFFAQQPLMGPLSLLVRAPFVAIVFDADITTVYFVGAIPCVLALLALCLTLWRRMQHRSIADRLAVVLVCTATPIVVRAMHWGHPEELLASALCVGAMLAALGDRALLAGGLLGCAFATKQWALVAAGPTLVALPSRQRRFVLCAVTTGVAFTLPMLLGDPDRFWLVIRAAGSADPSTTLGGTGAEAFPAGRILPHSLFFWLSEPAVVDGRRYFFISGWLAKLTHPAILVVCLPLSFALWRRAGGAVPATTALRLLAFALLARCALDPNDLDYYHAPLMAALAALAAYGGAAEMRAALATGAGLTLAFGQPADSLSTLSVNPWPQFVLWILTVIGLGAWLLRGMLAETAQAQAGDAARAQRAPAAGATARLAQPGLGS